MTATLPPPIIRLVVCGNADRGDDGVALTAAATLLPTLPPDLAAKLEVRRCQELRTEDLIDLPPTMQVLLIDAVAGPRPGDLVRISLDHLTEHQPFTPRSSHQLPIELVVGIAGVVRDRPIEGVFLGLAGHRFDYGTRLSRATRAAMPAFREALEHELGSMVAAMTTWAGG